jgi:hypothetical protein
MWRGAAVRRRRSRNDRGTEVSLHGIRQRFDVSSLNLLPRQPPVDTTLRSSTVASTITTTSFVRWAPTSSAVSVWRIATGR